MNLNNLHSAQLTYYEEHYKCAEYMKRQDNYTNISNYCKLEGLDDLLYRKNIEDSKLIGGRKVKTFAKIVMIIISSIAIITIGGVIYITSGLDDGKNVLLESMANRSFDDGEYFGKYDSGRFSNKVKVIVENGKIIDIEVLKSVMIENPDITKKLISEVIEKQDTDIDIVTGATVTSKAYLKSIEYALKK